MQRRLPGLRALVQRVAKWAPGLTRRTWETLPGPLRKRLLPLTYAIALGPRGDSMRLSVPHGAPRRAVRIAASPETLARTAAVAGALQGSRYSPELAVVASPGALSTWAGREEVLDAVYVGTGDRDPVAVAARRLGFRVLPAAALSDPASLDGAFPPVTIVIAAHAGRALLEPCLQALLRNTPWPGLEVIAVDDGMGPDDAAWLREYAGRESGVLVLRNETSQGFARATNLGLRAARGDFLVMLNDDTVVGPGWLSRLVAHLEAEPALGLVGPRTNEIGNSAKLAVPYGDFAGMEVFALERTRTHAGRRLELPALALFCAAAPRAALESVGFLDERYEVGMFEDDDLSLALRRAGRRLAVAEDAFVHHVGQASFGRLGDDEYLRIWEANRRRFEQKWQVKWSPPEPESGVSSNPDC